MRGDRDIAEFGTAPRSCPTCYPGQRPGGSYILYQDHVTMLDPGDGKMSGLRAGDRTLGEMFPNIGGRYMVVGYGSNASPPQLLDKFKTRCDCKDCRDVSCVMPVLRGKLHGYDAIYEARFASSGYIPATITRSEGTVLEAWANILDEKQLCIMDCTEARGKTYDLVRLDARFELEGGETFDHVYAYVAKNGPLLVDGSPVRLEAVHADGSTFLGIEERDILERHMSLLPECRDLCEFTSRIGSMGWKNRKALSCKIEGQSRDAGFDGMIVEGSPEPVSEMASAAK